MNDSDFLSEKTRAEDIILGSLGFAEESRIIEIRRRDQGYCGTLEFSDGEKLEFESEAEIDQLEHWALSILIP